jgi:AcrR family transcriptional regulator
MLASRRDAAAAGFGRQWGALARGLVVRLAPGRPEAFAARLAAFLAAELPWWLLLAEDAEYRVLSQEAVSRAVMLASGAPDAVLPTMWLQRALAAPDPRVAVQAGGAKRKIIEAAAEVLVEGGVQALTHREVARRSSASLSSLTYHFASLDELIRWAFLWLFGPGGEGLQGRGVEAGPLALFELPLQALRDPGLASLATAFRRRLAQEAARGEIDAQALGRREGEVLAGIGRALVGEAWVGEAWVGEP